MTRPLPPAVLESHVGIMGKTGSGKSNLAKVVVEGLLDDGARVCVIDPTGTWFGLRLTPDRKASRFQPVIFGGEHADIPIARTHGAAVAETIGTSTTPAIIDTRRMTVGERTAFFADFAETLLQRNKGPLHLVVDEAHLFAPQGRVADPASGRMLHAANNLVSLGRGVGLRIILISQRPAKLHKDSLTQIETLVAMRLIAPQDRNAIEAWIDDVADPSQAKDLLSSLAKLPTGEGWVWSPEADILDRRRFPLASTLDTGKASDQPVELVSIDVDAVTERLAQIGIDLVANDPKALKAKVAELERQIAAKPTEQVEKVVEKVIEVPVLNGNLDRLEGVVRDLLGAGKEFASIGSAVVEAAELVGTAIASVKGGPSHEPRRSAIAQPVQKAPLGATAAPSDTLIDALKPAEKAVLNALAQYPDGRSRVQVALLSGYSSSSSTFDAGLAALRRNGFIVGGADRLRITEDGKVALGEFDPLPTGRELMTSWLAKMKPASRKLFETLVDAWPDALSKYDVAERAGYSPTSSTFDAALANLRKLDLIEGDGTALRAVDAIAEHR